MEPQSVLPGIDAQGMDLPSLHAIFPKPPSVDCLTDSHGVAYSIPSDQGTHSPSKKCGNELVLKEFTGATVLPQNVLSLKQ